MKVNEAVVERIWSIVQRAWAEPSNEKDCLGKPMPRLRAYIHGRYLNHLHVLFERGLVDYGPAAGGGWVVVPLKKGVEK